MDQNRRNQIGNGKLLGEILRIQHALGSSVNADALFGLLNGIESALKDDRADGISRDLQKKCEDVLEAIEAGTQSPEQSALKDRLKADGIGEPDFQTVMTYCYLGNRFGNAVEKIKESAESFNILPVEGFSHEWSGPRLAYELLIDNGRGKKAASHLIYSSVFPRLKEIVSIKGKKLEVVSIEHVVDESDNFGSEDELRCAPVVHAKAID